MSSLFDKVVYDRIVELIDVNGLASFDIILKDEQLKHISNLRFVIYKLLRQAYFYEAMTGMLALGEAKFESGVERPQVTDNTPYSKGMNPNNIVWKVVQAEEIKNPITRKKGSYEFALYEGSKEDLTNLVEYIIKTRIGYNAIEYFGYKYWVSNDRVTLNRRKIPEVIVKPIEDGTTRALALVDNLGSRCEMN